MNGKICLSKSIVILSAVIVVAILLVIVNSTVMNMKVAPNSRASGLAPTSVLNRKPGGASVTSSPLATPAPLTHSVAVCLMPKASSVKDSTDLFLKPGVDPGVFAKDRMVSIVGVKPGGGAELLTLVPVPEVTGERIAVLENKQFAKNTSYRFVATQKADPDIEHGQKADNYEVWVIESSKSCAAYLPSSR